jgi:hypothetical protein
VADAKSVKRPIHKLSIAELKEVKTQIDDLLETGYPVLALAPGQRRSFRTEKRWWTPYVR